MGQSSTAHGTQVKNSLLPRISLVGAFIVTSVALFVTAPVAGDFWFSDAPRHALNGVFLRDFIADLPFDDPKQYAIDYYLQWPALTIGFYPPLFYLIEAPFYAMFGVHHWVAQLVVALHAFALGLGVAALASRLMRPWAAIASGIFAVAAPSVAFWGRQVMLETPLAAFLVWAAVFLLRYMESNQRRDLIISVLVFLGALYVKLNALLVAPTFVAMLFWTHRRSWIRSSEIWIATALLVGGLLPLAVHQIIFGAHNWANVAGNLPDLRAEARFESLVWYVLRLPEIVGWPQLLLCLIALPAWYVTRTKGKPFGYRTERHQIGFLVVWIASGLLLLTGIALKEQRHAMILIPPVSVFAGLALDRLVGGRWAPLTALLAATQFAYAMYFWPPPSVAGYATAAVFVSDRATSGSAVLFSGYRDGSFIFSMRAGPRDDLSVVRADKLFLEVASRRSAGVKQADYSTEEIKDLLSELGIEYVVAQTDFWTDLDQMRRLQVALQSDRFERIERIPVTANYGGPREDHELIVYRNRAFDPKRLGVKTRKLKIPLIGIEIEGTTGKGEAGNRMPGSLERSR